MGVILKKMNLLRYLWNQDDFKIILFLFGIHSNSKCLVQQQIIFSKTDHWLSFTSVLITFDDP